MKNSISSNNNLSSYRPGIFQSDLNQIFTQNITEAIKSALIKFDKRIPGFVDSSLLLAPETRTSSPVRLLREPVTFQANGIVNLFPIGEGSGYAGGIMSSAADGFKCGKLFY